MSKISTVQLNIRLSEDDLMNLKNCQEIFGNLSQSASIRLLMKIFLGKIPIPPRFSKNTRFSCGKPNSKNHIPDLVPATKIENDTKIQEPQKPVETTVSKNREFAARFIRHLKEFRALNTLREPYSSPPRAGRGALPFCHLRLKAQKPLNPAYPKVLSTLGDHIRKHRLDLGLSQGQVAPIIGVGKESIYNWETGKAAPEIRFISKIYNFLGYAPYIRCTLLCQKIRLWRESLGLSQEQLAKQAGIDESSLVAWERGSRKPTMESKKTLEDYFANHFSCPIKLC